MKKSMPALLVLTVALCGCNSARPPEGGGATAFGGPATPAATRLTLLAVDRSGSTESIRAQLLETSFEVGTNFDSTRDAFRLYRFGRSIQEVYSQLPEDDDNFASVLAGQVKASDPLPGTDYPRAAQTLADAAAEAPEKEIRIVIVGDGRNDYAADPQSEERYRIAALRLARNPHVKWVRFWGVTVGTREEIRAVFKPLGKRLQIQSLDQNPLAP